MPIWPDLWQRGLCQMIEPCLDLSPNPYYLCVRLAQGWTQLTLIALFYCPTCSGCFTLWLFTLFSFCDKKRESVWQFRGLIALGLQSDVDCPLFSFVRRKENTTAIIFRRYHVLTIPDDIWLTTHSQINDACSSQDWIESFLPPTPSPLSPIPFSIALSSFYDVFSRQTGNPNVFTCLSSHLPILSWFMRVR